ncbi:F0F1 ATP synthase subunit delta [Pinisolibacter sp. B13]|nr:F0F1 ATP synthase subunit delta [Pinisolibacter aquiterrae]
MISRTFGAGAASDVRLGVGGSGAVAETTSIVSGVARRYASALFEVALEGDAVDAVGRDLDTFDGALAGSADLRRLVQSPVFSSGEQTRAVSAVLSMLGIGGYAANFIGLAARNRRLFVLPGMIEAYRQLVAAHRGEQVAEVTSAHSLTEDQISSLSSALASVAQGKQIRIVPKVDPSIIGGLIVKVGSRMIDTSLKTKLTSLKVALKEVR